MSENQYTELLIKTQQDCIEYLKLSLRLIDDKIPALHHLAESWRARYDALEKQYRELQAKINQSESTQTI